MKLLLKVNAVLILVFLVGLTLSYVVAQRLLLANARIESHDNARIMMESALAVRAYTMKEIGPLLTTQTKYVFLPQSVPSYSAVEYFNNLRKTFPEYTYKEATLNPTNPRDRAVDWEVDVVNHFRDHPDAIELTGARENATGRTLYLARPLRIGDAACLRCHSTVDAAPPTLIDRYGTANGFGWQFKEIVGAQIVTIPFEIPLKRAVVALRSFVYLLVGVFVFLFVAVNVLLSFMVVRPVRKLEKMADQVSLKGDLETPDYATRSRDEIAQLGASFNRMKSSLVAAIEMLRSQGG